MILRSACFALLVSATSALASAPKVVTDIPPVQSLVAMVMGQIGTPDVLVASGTSAHDMALRPSQAKTLSEADVVVWIGPQLSPGFTDQLAALAPRAAQLTLVDIKDAHLLPYRENALFEEHHDHDDHHDHDLPKGDTAIDPHLWLDPDNAIVWLPHIAKTLATIDQDNKDQYLLNAATAIEDIKAAQARAVTTLKTVKDTPLAAYHDAFQYYEHAFGLHVVGAISDSDAVQPGPKRINSLRTAFETDAPVCFLLEPGANPRLLASVGWDATAAENGKDPIARIDPLGGALESGAGLYPSLITDIADRIASCVAAQ